MPFEPMADYALGAPGGHHNGGRHLLKEIGGQEPQSYTIFMTLCIVQFFNSRPLDNRRSI